MLQSLVTGLALLVRLQAPAEPVPAPALPPAEAAPTPSPAPAPAPTEAAPAPEKKSPLPPKTRPRLLVMDLVDKGAGAEITGALSQAMQGQAVTSHLGETITTTQIQLLLDANSLQQLVGCDAEACMTQIGNTIEADLILGGNVAKVGDDVLITMLTVDPKTGGRVKQEQRKTPVNRDLYFYTSKQLASLLLTGRAADPRVPVLISVVDKGSAVEGTIIVDGKDYGFASTKLLELDPGSHELVIKRSGFADWRTLLDVQDGAPQHVTATLVSERVYLWPVAVATGAVAAVTGAISLIMFDAAVAEYEGQSVLFKAQNGAYKTVSPTDSADLCAREQNIFNLSGRLPNEGESLGATNACGVIAGPGFGAGFGIASLVLVGVTGGLLVTDLVLGAE